MAGGQLFGTQNGPLVIAHRGASRAAPENTLAAFAAAIDMRCDAVELDVRRTADGVLVVHHAAQRRGTPVSRLTYADLARRSRHVPARLADAVALCAGRIGLDVELKDEGIEDEVLAVVAQRFPASALLLSSFHESVIANIKRTAPHLRCGLLVGPSRLVGRAQSQQPALERAERCNADVLMPHYLLAGGGTLRRRRWRRGVVESAAGSGVAVIVWTVNGSRRMARFLGDTRVAGIITDLPDVATEVRSRLHPPSATAPR